MNGYNAQRLTAARAALEAFFKLAMTSPEPHRTARALGGHWRRARRIGPPEPNAGAAPLGRFDLGKKCRRRGEFKPLGSGADASLPVDAAGEGASGARAAKPPDCSRLAEERPKQKGRALLPSPRRLMPTNQGPSAAIASLARLNSFCACSASRALKG